MQLIPTWKINFKHRVKILKWMSVAQHTRKRGAAGNHLWRCLHNNLLSLFIIHSCTLLFFSSSRAMNIHEKLLSCKHRMNVGGKSRTQKNIARPLQRECRRQRALTLFSPLVTSNLFLWNFTQQLERKIINEKWKIFTFSHVFSINLPPILMRWAGESCCVGDFSRWFKFKDLRVWWLISVTKETSVNID